MQLKPYLIRAARIVVFRNDERVLVVYAVERAMAAELEAARHVGLVGASVPHARQRFLERHTRFENRIDSFSSARGMGCRPERSECAIDGRRGLLRRNRKCGGKAAGDHRAAESKHRRIIGLRAQGLRAKGGSPMVSGRSPKTGIPARGRHVGFRHWRTSYDR